MRWFVMMLLIIGIPLYTQSDEGIRPTDIKRQTHSQPVLKSPHSFPIEVKTNPEVRLQHGAPPVMPVLDIKKLKENLKPQTARKIGNIQYRKADNLNPISFSRAEAIASYKAMLQKKIAEEELKNMVRRGATDKEIEDFKMMTDEKILQTRLEIMKAFGTQKEIDAAEEAIIKFSIYKNTKAREEK